MINFLTYFAPLETDISRGYRSLLICQALSNFIRRNEFNIRIIHKTNEFWMDTINAHKVNMIVCLGKIYA
jgi:hypothetical protein